MFITSHTRVLRSGRPGRDRALRPTVACHAAGLRRGVPVPPGARPVRTSLGGGFLIAAQGVTDRTVGRFGGHQRVLDDREDELLNLARAVSETQTAKAFLAKTADCKGDKGMNKRLRCDFDISEV